MIELATLRAVQKGVDLDMGVSEESIGVLRISKQYIVAIDS